MVYAALSFFILLGATYGLFRLTGVILMKPYLEHRPAFQFVVLCLGGVSPLLVMLGWVHVLRLALGEGYQAYSGLIIWGDSLGGIVGAALVQRKFTGPVRWF